MSDHFKNVRASIVVFAMPGCTHCHEYLPKLEKHVDNFKRYGIPFAYYANREVPSGQVPIIVIDSTSQHPQIVEMLDRFKIEGMPTTVLFTHNARPQVLEGDLDDAQIHELLSSAAIACR